MDIFMVRVASLVAVALLYLLYDLFNNRSIPSVFAYATVAFGVFMTILYFNYAMILISIAVAAAIFGIGYLLYRKGQLGFGDITEFAALSLIFPFQQTPLMNNLYQYNIPFIVSVVIAAGLAAILIVPIFYIPAAKKKFPKALINYISKKDASRSIIVGLSYMLLIAVMVLFVRIQIYGILILAALTFGSVFTILFENPITNSMVANVGINELEEEDIIAMNMLSEKTKRKLNSEIKGFTGLVTRDMIVKMKRKHIKIKLPVYKKGIPFAVPLFVGVIITLLFGNLFFILL